MIPHSDLLMFNRLALVSHYVMLTVMHPKVPIIVNL